MKYTMLAGFTRVINQLRRPEYTGENRCTPCTVVNLVIAIALAGIVVVAMEALIGIGPGLLLGTGVLSASSTAVYLRGYLIPGTPWITKTYFPDRVLRLFDKAQAPDDKVSNDALNVEAVLQDAGAISECANIDDLCLTDEFQDAWRERITALRKQDTTRDALAPVLEVDSSKLSFDEYGDAFRAYVAEEPVGQWESRAAFIADVAAAVELRARYGPWSDTDATDRMQILNSLRIFLEKCPACDEQISITQEAVESCCRSIDVLAVRCENCDIRVFETEYHG